jgi:hypothetical protein
MLLTVLDHHMEMPKFAGKHQGRIVWSGEAATQCCRFGSDVHLPLVEGILTKATTGIGGAIISIWSSRPGSLWQIPQNPAARKWSPHSPEMETA